jgi:[ribosomal protein S5]-alanine N-acetyltransferase
MDNGAAGSINRDVKQQPSVVSERMVLRPLMAKDARVVQRLARSHKVAYMTHWLFLPHSEQKALWWIEFTAKNFARRSSVEFAIQLRHGGRMVGLIGLDHINAQDSVAELWYMIVPTCWGKGYATEAARAAVRFGVEHLGLNRIWSYHMVRNPASGRVLAKVGMKREGLLRQHVRKNEVFEDVVARGLLREEWEKLSQE